MKNRTMILAMAAVTLLVAGCQKEKSFDGMLILAEGFNSPNTKLAINGNVSTWADGDSVRINNKTATVSISESQAKVTLDAKTTSPFYGVYPADIYSSNTGANYTLTLPDSYAYATDGTYQLLATPMVGYTNDASVMEFKHVTAAIGVQVVNYYGFTIEVDSIVVVSDKYKLNGLVSVTLSSSDPTVIATPAANDAEKKVKMVGGSSLQVFAGDSTVVQIPVLPVGSDNHFNIKTYVHKVDQTAVKKTLDKTQVSGGALARKQIGYARMATPGLFSVSASKKVIISQGNLMYKRSTGAWSFMKTQYGTVETSDQDVGENYENQDSVTLFGWGTSGWNNNNLHYMPYNTVRTTSPSNIGYGYGPTDGSTYTYDLTGTYSNADWGYNSIENGGTGWRSLITHSTNSQSEWYYLMKSRTTTYKDGYTSIRFVKANLMGRIHGFIIFPDNYEHPLGVDAPTGFNKEDATSWNANTFSESEWTKMEAAGAVFFPASGVRASSSSALSTVTNVNEYCEYWTATNGGANYAYCFRLVDVSLNTKSSWGRNRGCAVRLVRDVD